MDLILSQTNPPYLLQIQYNIILTFTPASPNYSLPRVTRLKLYTYFSSLQSMAHLILIFTSPVNLNEAIYVQDQDDDDDDDNNCNNSYGPTMALNHGSPTPGQRAAAAWAPAATSVIYECT